MATSAPNSLAPVTAAPAVPTTAPPITPAPVVATATPTAVVEPTPVPSTAIPATSAPTAAPITTAPTQVSMTLAPTAVDATQAPTNQVTTLAPSGASEPPMTLPPTTLAPSALPLGPTAVPTFGPTMELTLTPTTGLPTIQPSAMPTTSAPPELRGAFITHTAINTAFRRSRMIESIVAANLNSVFVAIPPVSGSGQGPLQPFVAFVEELQQITSNDGDLVILAWIQNHQRRSGGSDFRKKSEIDAQVTWCIDILFSFPCLHGIAMDFVGYDDESDTISNVDKNEGVSETIRRVRLALNPLNKILLTTTNPAAYVTVRGSTGDGWEGAVPMWYQDWYSATPNNYFAQEATTGGTGIVNQQFLGGESQLESLLGPSFMAAQQDPVTWMQRGLVNYIVSTQYTSDVNVFENEVDLWEEWCAFYELPIETMILGLGWLNDPDLFPDGAFAPAAVVSNINYARNAGISGFTIFRLGPDQDDAPLIEALNNENGPFVLDAQSTLRPLDGWDIYRQQYASVIESGTCLDMEYYNALPTTTSDAASMMPTLVSFAMVFVVLILGVL